jgi:DNA-binding NarL/FixJ family response regulator
MPSDLAARQSRMSTSTEATPEIRVLLADDHAMVREGLRLLLEAEADLCVVGEAADGAAAVAQALALCPHVVVMDVTMPIKDGVQATREIRTARPDIAVLALTGYDAADHVAHMLDAGALGFLVKVAPAATLVDAVRAVSRGETVLPPEIAARALRRAVGRSVPGQQARPLLSEREMDVLREAAQGLPNKEIARRLSLSVRTVHAHLGSIFAKLGVNSRTEAVLLALRKRWVTLREQDGSDTSESD